MTSNRTFAGASPPPRGDSDPKTSSKLPISAAIICKDEQSCIGKCLSSLAEFSEIVIVDSGSTDGTLEVIEHFISQGFPIKLFREVWRGYAKQKQFALEQTSGAWIFSIDADEWLDDRLRTALPHMLDVDPSVAGWIIRRSLTLYGSPAPLSSWTRPELILRLIRRGRGRFDANVIVHEGINVDGPTRIARKGVLRHERGLPLQEQMKKEIEYARLKATQRLAAGKQPTRIKMIVSPPLYFLRIFFYNRLFLCGWRGVVHAATGAMYSFLAEAMHYQMSLDVDNLHRPRSIEKPKP